MVLVIKANPPSSRTLWLEFTCEGLPYPSDAWQSTFIYEHEIVFTDPLYMEILDWKPNSATVVRIAHVTVPNAKNAKTRQDVNKNRRKDAHLEGDTRTTTARVKTVKNPMVATLRESEINTGNNSSNMGKVRLRRKQNSVAGI
ncbi:hypothetical protein PsorP6_012859 [Peronosclerospora sorghi]|uniref:Uncharacterized protein n=1 Tax=Peronosclerospora sorghi TaxID=230839 RepID=A0ACC0WF81_9STRA|nr:hypothetical protein PsorP6_012859 [Peronosclerospora sorghi]